MKKVADIHMDYGITGIYQLEFSNEKKYVGQAVDCRARILKHLKSLEYNKHDNPYMQKVYNKYGRPSARIIKKCERSSLTKTEQFYIDSGDYEININKKASSLDADMICKMIKARNCNKKPITCINTGVEYQSIKNAAEVLSLNAADISNTLNKKQSSVKGLYFKYTEDTKWEVKQLKSKGIKIRCIETNRVFKSASDAGKTLSIHPSNITRCANKKSKYYTAGGYKWEWV